jgi:hypothetical protein
MMEKVSQRLARANHEKIKLKLNVSIEKDSARAILTNCTAQSAKTLRHRLETTHQGLNVKEKHAKGIVTTSVQPEKVDQRVLSDQ